MSAQNYKLSPSDFAYLYEECKYCYYQKIKNGISYSGPFPAMFGRINKLLQDSIMGKNLQEIIPDLPSGVINIQEGFIRSVVVPGTNVFLSGRFDILTLLDDGTYAIIDFKITAPDDEKLLKKYTSQLHAYKFALENPAEGNPIKISKMGAVSVNPDEMRLESGKIIFTTTPTYHPIEENMDGFLTLMSDISELLDGETPQKAEACGLCLYRARFEDSTSQDELPF